MAQLSTLPQLQKGRCCPNSVHWLRPGGLPAIVLRFFLQHHLPPGNESQSLTLWSLRGPKEQTKTKDESVPGKQIYRLKTIYVYSWISFDYTPHEYGILVIFFQRGRILLKYHSKHLHRYQLVWRWRHKLNNFNCAYECSIYTNFFFKLLVTDVLLDYKRSRDKWGRVSDILKHSHIMDQR